MAVCSRKLLELNVELVTSVGKQTESLMASTLWETLEDRPDMEVNANIKGASTI